MSEETTDPYLALAREALRPHRGNFDDDDLAECEFAFAAAIRKAVEEIGREAVDVAAAYAAEQAALAMRARAAARARDHGDAIIAAAIERLEPENDFAREHEAEGYLKRIEDRFGCTVTLLFDSREEQPVWLSLMKDGKQFYLKGRRLRELAEEA